MISILKSFNKENVCMLVIAEALFYLRVKSVGKRTINCVRKQAIIDNKKSIQFYSLPDTRLLCQQSWWLLRLKLGSV